jgi:two-component system, chemotaxis family, protein-glutamate methylesterase/glutaminase
MRFRSTAQCTCGMGEMYDAVTKAIAQDETSCVVFATPTETIIGAVDQTFPLNPLPTAIVGYGKGH